MSIIDLDTLTLIAFRECQRIGPGISPPSISSILFAALPYAPLLDGQPGTNPSSAATTPTAADLSPPTKGGHVAASTFSRLPRKSSIASQLSLPACLTSHETVVYVAADNETTTVLDGTTGDVVGLGPMQPKHATQTVGLFLLGEAADTRMHARGTSIARFGVREVWSQRVSWHDGTRCRPRLYLPSKGAGPSWLAHSRMCPKGGA